MAEVGSQTPDVGGQKSEKVVMEFHVDGKVEGYLIFCPGCQSNHLFDSRWKFNGNFVKPTFVPSMDVNKFDPNRRCHSVVTDGMIAFQNECWHALKGKTVPLEDIDGV